jgi:hypothetical protein
VTSSKSNVLPVNKKSRGLNIGHWRNDFDRVELNYSEKNLSKYHSIHHKSHTDTSVNDKDAISNTEKKNFPKNLQIFHFISFLSSFPPT